MVFALRFHITEMLLNSKISQIKMSEEVLDIHTPIILIKIVGVAKQVYGIDGLPIQIAAAVYHRTYGCMPDLSPIEPLLEDIGSSTVADNYLEIREDKIFLKSEVNIRNLELEKAVIFMQQKCHNLEVLFQKF